MTSLVPREPLQLDPGRVWHVDLGCGDGHFLIEMASRYPEVGFIGLDIRSLFLDEGRAEVARLGLTNLRLEASNLIVDLDHLFGPERVERFTIQFPDPWFKHRQHGRRWLTPKTVRCLCEALRPGGTLWYQSDVWDLALEALGLFESSPCLRNQAGDWSFFKQLSFWEGVQTTREESCLREGRRIWRMLFRKPR